MLDLSQSALLWHFPASVFFFTGLFPLSSVVTTARSLQSVIIFCCNSAFTVLKKLFLSYFMQFNQLTILQ